MLITDVTPVGAYLNALHAADAADRRHTDKALADGTEPAAPSPKRPGLLARLLTSCADRLRSRPEPRSPLANPLAGISFQTPDRGGAAGQL